MARSTFIFYKHFTALKRRGTFAARRALRRHHLPRNAANDICLHVVSK
jgi:hypothetical protein